MIEIPTWKLVSAVALAPKVVSAAAAAELVVVAVVTGRGLDSVVEDEEPAPEVSGIVDTATIEDDIDDIDELVDEAALIQVSNKHSTIVWRHLPIPIWRPRAFLPRNDRGNGTTSYNTNNKCHETYPNP